MDASRLESLFFLGQVVLATLAILAAIHFVRKRDTESRFKSREADRVQASGKKSGDALANARLGSPASSTTSPSSREPLRLTGIRLDGPPNEILGVSPDASPSEIQKAYRDLMKRYHPDKIGRPNSPEWKDAQRIAERLNDVKTELLKKAKARS